MKRVYIFKDGMMQGSTATRESAIDLIRQYQARETHPILKAQFSIISGRKNSSLTPVQKKNQKHEPESWYHVAFYQTKKA